MNTATFHKFRELIYKESGISLTEDKIPLLSNRIAKRLRALGLTNEKEYLSALSADESGQELINLIDVVSTNVTYFYREAEHFDFLSEALRAMSKSNTPVRGWCAASSSGEEPYTIAITVKESMGPSANQFKLLATDICMEVLERACKGVYPAKQLEKAPKHILSRYFRKLDKTRSNFVVHPELKNMIVYKRLNLSSFPYPLKGPLSFIFCRNVMIYFDLIVRQKAINEFYRLLQPGGYLFLSRSENLLGINHNFVSVATSVYQKPFATAAQIQ